MKYFELVKKHDDLKIELWSLKYKSEEFDTCVDKITDLYKRMLEHEYKHDKLITLL